MTDNSNHHPFSQFVLAPIVLCMIFLVFFQQMLITLISETFYYTDEMLLVAATILMFIPLVKEADFAKLLILTLTLFIVFFVLSFNSLKFRSELTVFMQLLIHFKFFFFFLLFYNFRRLINFSVLIHLFFIVTIFGILINYMMGESFSVLIDAPIQYRFNVIRPVGFQGNTGNLGLSLAFFYMFYVLRGSGENYKTILLLTLGFVVLFLFSSVRTPFIALMIVLVLIFGASFKKMLLGGLCLLLLMPLLMTEYVYDMITLSLENVSSLSEAEDSQYIRGMMIYFSVVLAGDYFPFGSGAASYGTALSVDSPIYQDLGLSTMIFFVEMAGIYDSNFASLLGEFGVVGMILFMYLLMKVLKLANRNGSKKFVLGFGVVIVFYSLVSPIYMTSYPAMLLSLVLVGAINRHQEAQDDREDDTHDHREDDTHDDRQDNKENPLLPLGNVEQSDLNSSRHQSEKPDVNPA